MKKILLTILIVSFWASQAFPQLHRYKYRLGISMGYSNYMGDIQPYGMSSLGDLPRLFEWNRNYAEDLSYQLSFEYELGKSVGLMLTGGMYQFGSSDRLIKNDGTIFQGGRNFSRALNFQTRVRDVGLGFVIKPDNGWLLSGNSFLAPYLVVGGGFMDFQSRGDLLDASGNRYDYSGRNLIPDGRFETLLRPLQTEGTNYDNYGYYAHLGLGLRFRIADGIEIFAQSDFKMTNSDYLDDVSGEYSPFYVNDFQRYAAIPGSNIPSPDNPFRGNPNQENDWYIYHGFGIKFSFGKGKESFEPPVISQRYEYIPEVMPMELAKPSVDTTFVEKKLEIEAPQTITNNYFTVIQLPAWKKSDTRLDSVSNLAKRQELDLNTLALDSIAAEQESVEKLLDSLESQWDFVRADTSFSEEIQMVQLAQIDSISKLGRNRMESLNESFKNLQVTRDSLSALPDQFLIDSTSLQRELLIIPGQVSRIIYAADGAARLEIRDSIQNRSDTFSKSFESKTTVDSSSTAFRSGESQVDTIKVSENQKGIRDKSETVQKVENSSMRDSSLMQTESLMSRDQFERELEKFKSEMLSQQAKRDSVLMMTLADKLSQNPEEFTVRNFSPRERGDEKLDRKVARELERNRRRQERLEKRNNKLLRDALLVGGTAATTAALTGGKEEVRVDTLLVQDTTLLLQLDEQKYLLDSLQATLDSLEDRKPDTIRIQQNVETILPIILNQEEVQIYFDINQSEVSESESGKLQNLVKVMERNPDLAVVLLGFADNTGSVAYNLQLVEKRVQSVKNKLLQLGLDEARIRLNEGGMIIRSDQKGSQDSDRRVEIRLRGLGRDKK